MLLRRNFINTNSTPTTTTAGFLVSSLRTYFGHDVKKGVKGETDRGGPQRVPSMRPDRTLFDPTLRSPDEIREAFDRENEQIELESAKMRANYTGNHNFKVQAAGLEHRINASRQQQQEQADASGGGRTTERYSEKGDPDLTESIKNATPTRGEYTFEDPDEKMNPHKYSFTGGFGSGFDDRTVSANDSFLTGSIHDRESIRVRGQKPPPDLPLTDEETWHHPTAKNMRIVGIFMMIFILDVMWRLTTDPFSEGERYTKFAIRQENKSKDETTPWLKASTEEEMKKQVDQAKVLRDSLLPWRQ